MKTFTDIIDAWPSPRDLAADLGVAASLVAVWRHRDSIHADHWADLVDAARHRKIPVTLEQLALLAKQRRAASKGGSEGHRERRRKRPTPTPHAGEAA